MTRDPVKYILIAVMLKAAVIVFLIFNGEPRQTQISHFEKKIYPSFYEPVNGQ